jgi:hypothetical protein
MVSLALHSLLKRSPDGRMRAVEFGIAIHEEGAILAEFRFTPRQFCEEFAVKHAH